jgi:uncharacterized protein YceK
VVLGGCRSVSTLAFVGQLDVVVGFMLCGCASVFTLRETCRVNKNKNRSKSCVDGRIHTVYCPSLPPYCATV